MGLKRLGNLILQLAFKSKKFSSFKWLQRGTKFDPNCAKMAIFSKKFGKIVQLRRLELRSITLCVINASCTIEIFFKPNDLPFTHLTDLTDVPYLTKLTRLNNPLFYAEVEGIFAPSRFSS